MYADALAFNPQGLDRLRLLARQEGGREAVRAAAQQFEAHFLQLMLRSMRQTLTQDGPFDSAEARMFGEMFDQQVALDIAQNKGLGLAELIERQIRAFQPAVDEAAAPMHITAFAPASPAPRAEMPPRDADTAAIPVEATSAPSAQGELTQATFVETLWPHAVDAAARLGVAPHFLIAQAALETGWGRHVLQTDSGLSSHNLFNIKAGSGWRGETVDKVVLEYVAGRPVHGSERFRAYASYAEAFADYARLLTESPRYAGVLGQDAAGFAHGLQRAGYATDPGYAQKLLRVMHSAFFRERLQG